MTTLTAPDARHTRLARSDTTLADALERDAGTVYLTGTQAIVRAVLAQARRDRAAGLNTAGYISGYRGSPLGGVDQAMWKARRALEAHAIRFEAGLNEDLAATAIWGTQQVGLFEPPRVEGVFGVWYGKGPGVDRSGDPFKHANLAGTAPNGGVLVLAGDDHMCKSSTTAHQSEPALIAAGIPVLNPASVEELVTYALYGIAASRVSGCWIAQKCLTDVVDSSASVMVDTFGLDVRIPAPGDLPPGGLHIRRADTPLQQEERLWRWKLPAVGRFAAANGLDRVTHDARHRRIGVVTTGKSWLDVQTALRHLGLTEERRAAAGIAIYKVGMSWPLEAEGLRRFAATCEELVFVEEKRALIEDQACAALYSLPADRRPVLSGKSEPDGRPLLPVHGELDAATIAQALGRRLVARGIVDAAEIVDALPPPTVVEPARVTRSPWFCAGCPHNSSTKLPEGSTAGGGIGCHTLAVFSDPDTTLPYTHMGGEGMTWVGRSRFVETRHLFQNMGDGTYNHSGLLAIRAAVAAGDVNITFKVLYNEAVAMTGGQPHEGRLTADAIARQVAAEGVRRIAVVADDPGKYPTETRWPAGTTLSGRDELDRVQCELREVPGVTVLIYDQVCATERRRQRKRGLRPKAATRVFINDLVCEGCGDCGLASNCVAVQPLDTPLGRKRTIDQSACNADLSCLKGFCPSFVTGPANVTAAAAPEPTAGGPPPVPDPVVPALDRPYGVLVTGVGGTGVVTVGALLGMAAHLEGKACRVVDQAGMAQKNGGVRSHILFAPSGVLPSQVPAGQLDLLLAADLVVAAAADTLRLASTGRTRAVVNSHVTPIGAFTRSADLDMDGRGLLDRLTGRLTAEDVAPFDASGLAVQLLGDSVAANLMLVGYAWQKGWLPLSAEALLRAIALNGVEVARNQAAFSWGRALAHDPALVPRATSASSPAAETTASTRLVERQRFLTSYQDAAYADRYVAFVDRVRRDEASRLPGSTELTQAVSDGLFKLMTYKDEYEVARLLTEDTQLARMAEQAGGADRLRFHLAPPLLARPDPATGHPRKLSFGAWIIPVLRMVSRLKPVRGTAFDVFGWTRERRTERAMITDYMALIERLLPELDGETRPTLVALARLPLQIRGYGHVKEAARQGAERTRERLLAELSGRCARTPDPGPGSVK